MLYHLSIEQVLSNYGHIPSYTSLPSPFIHNILKAPSSLVIPGLPCLSLNDYTILGLSIYSKSIRLPSNFPENPPPLYSLPHLYPDKFLSKSLLQSGQTFLLNTTPRHLPAITPPGQCCRFTQT